MGTAVGTIAGDFLFVEIFRLYSCIQRRYHFTLDHSGGAVDPGLGHPACAALSTSQAACMNVPRFCFASFGLTWACAFFVVDVLL